MEMLANTTTAKLISQQQLLSLTFWGFQSARYIPIFKSISPSFDSDGFHMHFLLQYHHPGTSNKPFLSLGGERVPILYAHWNLQIFYQLQIQSSGSYIRN